MEMNQNYSFQVPVEERLKEWLIITEVAMYFSQMN